MSYAARDRARFDAEFARLVKQNGYTYAKHFQAIVAARQRMWKRYEQASVHIMDFMKNMYLYMEDELPPISETQPPPPPPPPPRQPEGSYYEWLGISPTAAPGEVRKAYLKAALQNHPDKGGDAEKFKRILEAYETLSDTDRRMRYDRERGASPAPSPAPAPPPGQTDAQKAAQEEKRRKWREAKARAKAREDAKKEAAKKAAQEEAEWFAGEWGSVRDFEDALEEAYAEEDRARRARQAGSFEHLASIYEQAPPSLKRKAEDDFMRRMMARTD